MRSEPDGLAGRDPVVWELAGYELLAGAEVLSRGELEHLVASLGCKILYYGDDIAYDRFELRVRVPRAEHERRSEAGYPQVVEQIWGHLQYEMVHDEAGGGGWYVAPHEADTLRFAAGQTLRAAYADLLDPLEEALAPLRRDGYENDALDVTFWGGEEGLQIGVWNLPMSNDLWHMDTAVISAGVAVDDWVRATFDAHFGYPDSFDVELANWADDLAWDGPPGGLSGQLDPRHPILLLPRPDQPIWSVTFARPSFSSRAEMSDRRPRDPQAPASWPASCHQWTGADPQTLAAQVADDVSSLLPDAESFMASLAEGLAQLASDEDGR